MSFSWTRFYFGWVVFSVLFFPLTLLSFTPPYSALYDFGVQVVPSVPAKPARESSVNGCYCIVPAMVLPPILHKVCVSTFSKKQVMGQHVACVILIADAGACLKCHPYVKKKNFEVIISNFRGSKKIELRSSKKLRTSKFEVLKVENFEL